LNGLIRSEGCARAAAGVLQAKEAGVDVDKAMKLVGWDHSG